MNKRSEPGIRLRIERFKQRCAEQRCCCACCAERDPGKKNSFADYAEIIGMSRPTVSRIARQRDQPGATFIAAALLAFADENTTPGAVFDDLFEVVPAAAQQRDLPDAA